MDSPSATSAASTSEAEARRSEHITAAAESGDLPRTVALRPSTLMFAPMRTSSSTCIKRFSKMFSVMTEVPSACVASAIYCACMSVGKPGYSSVEISAAFRFPSLRTRIWSLLSTSMRAPASSSLLITAPRCAGLQFETQRSPPVIAPAIRKVPASMRSGLMRCFAPCSFSTPCTRILDVPAPSILVADLRAHRSQPFDVQINGASANGAASGHRHARQTGAGNQRSHHQRRSAHGLHNLILGHRIRQQPATDARAVLRASIPKLNLCPHRDKQLALRLNVPHLRNIFKDHLVLGKNGRRHTRKGRVLGPAHANSTDQRIAAANNKLVHNALD